MHSHHDHSHAHGKSGHHHHLQARAGERTKLVLTIALTSVILVVEVLGGWWSHSLSLLSDAGHMFSDVVAQGLSLGAVILAARPADARRTYGFYRVEILAALMNGLTLFALSFGILWKAIYRFEAPVPISAGLMLSVAAVGLVANLIGAWLLHDLRSLNAKGAYLHLLFDTLSSFLVLIGGIAMWALKGAYFLDPLLSCVIGLFILYSAYRLVREAVDILLEAVPLGIDLAGVTHAIDTVEGVSAVHDLHIWTITSGMNALSAHIVVRGHSEENDELLNRIQSVLLDRFDISHTTLQLESEEHEHVGHVC